MRIAKLAAQTIRWAIASDGAARGRTERSAVVIEARAASGAIGLGEAAPIPGMSLDTLDDAERAIAGFAQRAPFEIADREAVYELAAEAVSGAARFAIETALLDAMARERGVSLAAMLGAPGHREVPLAAVVDDPDAARRAWASGIRWLKIKLVATDDPRRVLAIAAAVPGARLRIDANRTWPRGSVPARIGQLAQLPIDYVEEPCADTYTLLGTRLGAPLALDESLATLTAAQLDVALGSPGLAALVMKPTVLGGLSAVLALAGRARQAGVAAIVSHGLEGPIGTAACAELALAIGGDRAAGLAVHPALAGWPCQVAQLAPDRVRTAPGPGLGFAGAGIAAIGRPR